MSEPKFYQVGGAVRDELLGIKSKDVDYAVEAESYEQMREAVEARGYVIKTTTPRFVTLKAMSPAGQVEDFTLCRKDGEYKDGRRPETVTVGSIYDDLARRDFTVNAIAKNDSGAILDPYNGRKDLKAGLLRCVGKAETRFTEDGLRILRAVRFNITKSLRLDPEIDTLLQVRTFIEQRMKGVSHERVMVELRHCFTYDTNRTLEVLDRYSDLRKYLFYKQVLWLKPTLELR